MNDTLQRVSVTTAQNASMRLTDSFDPLARDWMAGATDGLTLQLFCAPEHPRLDLHQHFAWNEFARLFG